MVPHVQTSAWCARCWTHIDPADLNNIGSRHYCPECGWVVPPKYVP